LHRSIVELSWFRRRLGWLWRRVLARRSQRGWVSWQRLNVLSERWIPLSRVLHPYAMDRFDSLHPRLKPYA